MKRSRSPAERGKGGKDPTKAHELSQEGLSLALLLRLLLCGLLGLGGLALVFFVVILIIMLNILTMILYHYYDRVLIELGSYLYRAHITNHKRVSDARSVAFFSSFACFFKRFFARLV